MGLTLRLAGGPALDRGPILGLDPSDPDRLVLSTRRSGFALVFGALLLVTAAILELGLFERPLQPLRLAGGIAIGVLGALLFSRKLTILDRSRQTLEHGIGLVVLAVASREPCRPRSLTLRERTDTIETDDSTCDVTSFEALLDERPLIRDARWEEVRPRAELLSAFLRLPLVDEVSGLTLAPEELDVPLAERARRLGWSRTHEAPGDGKAVVETPDDHSLHVRFPSPRGSGLLGLTALAFFGFTIPVTLLGGPIFSLLPTVLAFVAWVKVRFGLGASLRVDRERITIENQGLVFARVTRIPVRELEDLLVRSPEDTPSGFASALFSAVLIIRSDRATARLGWGLSRAELEWLRDEILAALTRVGTTRCPETPSPAQELPLYPAGVRVWPVAGWLAGMGLTLILPGRLSTCVALPFLEHVLSVGGLAGLGAGLLAARFRGHSRRRDGLLGAAIAAGLLTLLLAHGHHPLVQPHPTFSETVLGPSTAQRAFLAGWIPTASLANLGLAALLAVPLARSVGRARRWWRAWRATRPARARSPSRANVHEVARLLWGWVFVACGVTTPVVFLVQGHLAEGRIQSFAGGLVVGMLFLVPGLWALEAWTWLPRRWLQAKIDWNEVFGGSTATLMGAFIIAMAFAEDEERIHAPRGVIAAAGGAFAFAGLSILANLLPLSPRSREIATRVVAALLLACFAAVAIWATFGASPAFALGAVLLVGLLAVTVRSIWKAWKSN